jgi:hypothetical protein
MKKQLFKKYILNLLMLLVSNLSFGQVEYFVRVNPTTCSYTITDSLSGVKWIAGGSVYDKINKKYVFHGEDVNHNGYLYSVDALSGNIISNPPWANYFSLMKFDNSTGILYGIHWTSTLAADADLVSINPTNLNYTIIHRISITGLSNDVTFDDTNHRFIFIGNDSLGNNCLFSVDVATGNIISKPVLNNNVSGIQFDNSSGTLYGLQWNNGLQTEYFVSINITTGSTTIISSIPLVNNNYNYPTFDEINKRYTFVWTNSSSNNYLYTINAINGLVISNPSFPVFINPHNLIEFKYDNSSGYLYALHWGADSEITGVTEINNKNSEIKIYPNPTQQYFIVELPKEQSFSLLVYDVTGRTIYENKTATGTVKVDCSNLGSGIYFVKEVNQRTVLTGKLVKE